MRATARPEEEHPYRLLRGKLSRRNGNLIRWRSEGYTLLRGNPSTVGSAIIRDEWIERAIRAPVRETIQADSGIRRWVQVPEMENRFLQVIVSLRL